MTGEPTTLSGTHFIECGRSDMAPAKLEESMHQLLERVLERAKALPDNRQWEVAEVLLASLDQASPDVNLSPRKIAKAEREAANRSRFATDEEVRKVFAGLTAREVRPVVMRLTR
jgi:hypothetical protein